MHANEAPAASPPPIGEQPKPAAGPRRRLLEGLPVSEHRVEAAGIETAVLEGGTGSPVVLLHGPGESAVNWRWVIPALAQTHRVIAPDLPAQLTLGGVRRPQSRLRPRAEGQGRGLFRALGAPRIPPSELARITTPTTLIWGRGDRALRVATGERASARYGR